MTDDLLARPKTAAIVAILVWGNDAGTRALKDAGACLANFSIERKKSGAMTAPEILNERSTLLDVQSNVINHE
jgi:hypothetical protein